MKEIIIARLPRVIAPVHARKPSCQQVGFFIAHFYDVLSLCYSVFGCYLSHENPSFVGNYGRANSSDGRVDKPSASGAAESDWISILVKSMTLKLVFTASCFDIQH